MKDINDQPQELLARYADRTGCPFDYLIHFKTWTRYQGSYSANEVAKAGYKIRLVLDPVTRLPSHLKPYKENPRDPGDGWRVPAFRESVKQPHEMYDCDERLKSFRVNGTFDWYRSNYRIPATVMPPDWEEMTKEIVQLELEAEERAKFNVWYQSQCKLSSQYEGLYDECLEAWKASKGL